MGDLSFPIKLNDDYPCRGIDAKGASIVFPDLLREGEKVGPSDEEDGGEALYVSGIVVRRDDGLWVEAIREVEGEVAELRQEVNGWKVTAEGRLALAREARAEADHLRAELRTLAEHHHNTLTPSGLHDPEHVGFEDCPAKTCKRARDLGTSAAPSTSTGRPE